MLPESGPIVIFSVVIDATIQECQDQTDAEKGRSKALASPALFPSLRHFPFINIFYYCALNVMGVP